MLEPRPYQTSIAKKGARLLHALRIVYLAMATRTGKTITAFLLLEEYFPRIHPGYNRPHVLFVTKKKIIPGIKADFKLKSWPFELTVTNYESLHKAEGNFNIIIMDEAHTIGAYPKRNVRNGRLRVMCEVPIIFLSATPAAESYSQLYHQFGVSPFSPWHHYKNFYQWAKDGYVNIRKKYLGSVMVNDYSNANKRKIFEDVKPYMITLTQAQAGFAGGVDERIIEIHMSDRTESIYKTLVRDRVYSTDDWAVAINGGGDLMNKCRQLASGTLIVGEEEDDKEAVILDESKARFIRGAYKDLRIAIFYYYRAEREMLLKYFPKATESPEAFQNYESDTFIGQVRSVREGIRLSSADVLIMLTIDFSAVSYQQAKARLQDKDRVGDAPLHWIFAKGLLEPAIYETVQSKDFTYQIFKSL